MELIDEWKLASSEGGDYDLYHFYTLFHYEFTRADANDLLQYFEEKDAIVERLMNYKAPKAVVSDEVLLEMVKLDVAEVLRICKQMDHGQEFIPLFENLEYVFVNEADFMDFTEQYDEHLVIHEIIGDHLVDSSKKSSKNRWLGEAFYGLTTDPQLKWYLSKPLSNSSYNPDLYFNIWKSLGDYYLGGGKVCIWNKGKL